MHWNGAGWRKVDSEMGILFNFDDLWGVKKNDVWAIGSTSTSERSLLHYDASCVWSFGDVTYPPVTVR